MTHRTHPACLTLAPISARYAGRSIRCMRQPMNLAVLPASYPYGKVGCFCRLYVFFFPSFTLVSSPLRATRQPYWGALRCIEWKGSRWIPCSALPCFGLNSHCVVWVRWMGERVSPSSVCAHSSLRSFVRGASRLCVSRTFPFVAKRCALHLLNDLPGSDDGAPGRWVPAELSLRGTRAGGRSPESKQSAFTRPSRSGFHQPSPSFGDAARLSRADRQCHTSPPSATSPLPLVAYSSRVRRSAYRPRSGLPRAGRSLRERARTPSDCKPGPMVRATGERPAGSG